MGGVNQEFSQLYNILLFKARERIKEHLLSGKREKIFTFMISEDTVAEFIHNALVGAFVNLTSSQISSNVNDEEWKLFIKTITAYQNNII